MTEMGKTRREVIGVQTMMILVEIALRGLRIIELEPPSMKGLRENGSVVEGRLIHDVNPDKGMIPGDILTWG